jgi:ubiquinone/menaquinone biosynthesis C-methylase UbiE
MKKNKIESDLAYSAYTTHRIDNSNVGVGWVSNPFGRAYHQNLSRIYRAIIPQGLRVLEIGCGEGSLLSAINPSLAVGIDFSEEKIKRAKVLIPDAHFYVMDAHSIDIREQNFDFIILSDLLNDAWDVQKILEEIRPLCTNQTRVVINIYSHLWNIPLKVARLLKLAKPQLSQNWLTKEDIFNFLRITGYEPLAHSREVLIPIPWFGHIFNRYLVKITPFNHLALSNFIIAKSDSASNNTNPSASIVIAARNEAGHIRQILERVPKLCDDMEIIFVEGGSTDNTFETIEAEMLNFPQIKCRLFRQTGKGKGDAVRLGFNEAKGDILIILDADMTVAPEDLVKFYNLIVLGKGEFINGVRLIYPMENQAMRFFNLLGNKFFSAAFTWLLGQSIRDTLCGTKVLSKETYLKIAANRSYFGDFDPFGDFDLLFGAARLNLKIIEVPIRYRARRYGETNISRWSHGWLLLQMVIFAARKIKFR